MILLLLLACHGPDDTGPGDTGPDDTGGAPVQLRVDGDTVHLDAGSTASSELLAGLDADGLSLRFELDAEGALTPVLSAGEGSGTLRAVWLTGPWSLAGEQAPAWWRQGYQSWSWSGVTTLSEPELDGALPRVGGDGDSLSVVAETPWTSWWAGLVGRPGGASLLLGALDARVTRTWLAAGPDALWIVWGGRGEALPVPAGGERRLDPVRAFVGEDAGALWEAWAEAAGARRGARTPSRPPETGWSDWYTFYGTADAEDILANAAIAADAGLELVQIDDGWERAWGDWTANERFPQGMAALADELDGMGLVPGLWMAPFYVERSLPVFTDHPDWFVTDAEGEPLDSVSCDCGVLDVTHPDAAAWMQAQVRAQVDAGYRYLKLDFLYAGGLEGRRREDLTGTEALDLGLALLREAAGDTTVLACGAPLLPSVGFADRYRSGADIAYVGSPDPDPVSTRWQARSTAARAFANGRWWWNDPDNLLVRAPLDEVQVRGAVAGNVAASGLWLLGDDLRTLPADRLALVTKPALLDRRGQLVTMEDPLSSQSGVDGGPPFEAAEPDDVVAPTWRLADGTTVLLALGEEGLELDGPGGTELLSGEQAAAGPRSLDAGEGEVWGR